MKKIIATVLAMVMALALCSTAFAADKYSYTVYTKAYDNKGNQLNSTETRMYVIANVNAKKAVGGNDASVAGYYLQISQQYTNETYAENLAACKTAIEGSYGSVVTYVAATAADYDLRLTADGRAVLYLSEAPNGKLTYANTAVEFTNIGNKCEQLNGLTTETYYSYTNDDGETTYYQDGGNGNTNVLVNGKLVGVTALDKDAYLVDHSWKAASYNKDNTVATYKCKDCGTVATVYKTVEAAVAAGMTTTDTVNGDVIGYKYGSSSTTTDGKTSPKTFDAGVAMYVGMALASVTGSAVVIGKKKEF